MLIIALSGYAGAGKDTIATLMQEQLEVPHARFAFADPLRLEVAAAFGVDRSLLTDPAVKNAPSERLALERCQDPDFVEAFLRTVRDPHPYRWQCSRSPREIMQAWGTEYRRAQHDRYWINRAEDHANRLEDDGAAVLIVTDCRFANEAIWARGRGGQVWRVERAGCEPINRHGSETMLDHWPFDQVVPNDGGLELLRKRVRDLLAGLRLDGDRQAVAA